jgi:hypothetical protein
MSNAALHNLTSVLTPEGMGIDRATASAQARPTHSTMTEETVVPLVQTDTMPSPRSIDKIGPPSVDDRYGEPPSKYGLMGWAYGPIHHGMGLTTTVLNSKASQANEGYNPGAWNHGQRLHHQQDNWRPGDGYQLMTTPSGKQETMTKATARPRRTGRLANHHHTNSVVMAGTMAPRHPIVGSPQLSILTTN